MAILRSSNSLMTSNILFCYVMWDGSESENRTTHAFSSGPFLIHLQNFLDHCRKYSVSVFPKSFRYCIIKCDSNISCTLICTSFTWGLHSRCQFLEVLTQVPCVVQPHKGYNIFSQP